MVDALKRRAAANGRSVEAEHRELLLSALLGTTEDFATRAEALRQRLHPTVGQHRCHSGSARRCTMITFVSLTGFKNFSFESLRVGPFTVLVGTNASGKSNIRDAFRFICGIGGGYTIAEIVGGKHIGGRPEWRPIRGAPHEIAKTDVGVFTLGVVLTLENLSASYLIGVGSEILGASGPKILTERFSIEDRVVFERDDGGLGGEISSTLEPIEHVFRKDQPYDCSTTASFS